MAGALYNNELMLMQASVEIMGVSDRDRLVFSTVNGQNLRIPAPGPREASRGSISIDFILCTVPALSTNILRDRKHSAAQSKCSLSGSLSC